MTTDSQLDTATKQKFHDKPNHRVVSDLIARANEGASPAVMAGILRTDPILCYAFLAEFGSGGAVPTGYVTSCRQAIEIMGLPVLVEWLEAALEHAVKIPKLSNRVRNTLIRARFMELIGRSAMSRDDTEDLYLVGLFSQLDKLLGISLAELILPLPFSEQLQAAILEQRGRVGRLLKFAQTIESADEVGIDFMETNMRLPSAKVYDAYNEAYDWVADAEIRLTTPA